MAVNPLTVRQAAELDSASPEQHWLIEALWMGSGVGLIGGAPKLCKSWLGLDMAVSLASGTPCLGRFAVPAAATALVYLAEDALPMVRSRIEALCRHRGLAIAELALYVIDTPYLQLDLAEHAGALRDAVERLKPRLLVLDPLVRLHRLDENSSHDMSGLLNYFRALQRTFDTAIVLVHHASKKRRAHPGQALRGSGDLHAFSDTGLYLARENEYLALTIEHRAAAAPRPLRLRLASHPDGSATHLAVLENSTYPAGDPSLPARILEQLQQSPAPMRRGALRAALRVNNERLGHALAELHQQGEIQHTEAGWRLATPAVTTPQTRPEQTELFA